MMDDKDKQIEKLMQQLGTTRAINNNLGKALMQSKEQVCTLMEAIEGYIRRVEAGEVDNAETCAEFKKLMEDMIEEEMKS